MSSEKKNKKHIPPEEVVSESEFRLKRNPDKISSNRKYLATEDEPPEKNKKNKQMKKNKSSSTLNELPLKEEKHLFLKDDIYQFTDLYFEQKNIIVKHQIDAFNKFVKDDIKKILTAGHNIIYEKIVGDKIIRHRFKYENISIYPPRYEEENNNNYMYPNDAILKNMTYASKITAKVTQIMEIENMINGKIIETKVVGKPDDNTLIVSSLPIMVRSSYCNLVLNSNPQALKYFCDYDPGGYFITNGAEKVVMAVERMCDNKPMITLAKESTGTYLICQVKSRSFGTDGLIQIITIKLTKTNSIAVIVPFFKEIPIFVLFKAFGIETDQDIINCVVTDPHDIPLMNQVAIALTDFHQKTDNKITTTEEAQKYLMDRLKTTKKYTETDKNIKLEQKRRQLKRILQEQLFLHLPQNTIVKGYYLGYMLKQLLLTQLSRRGLDDRDSLVNKRIDLIDSLLELLFRQSYLKALKECTKYFKNHNKDDMNPINIINQFKPNIIDQGIKTALMTGKWGNNSKKGIAQQLQRGTYIKTISDLRKIITTNVETSTKTISIRMVHNTQLGFLCPIETPEGQKIGLVKLLSLGASITLAFFSQMELVEKLIAKKVIEIADLSPLQLYQKTKIFINGVWKYVAKGDNNEIVEMIRHARRYGELEKTVSVAYNIDVNEIHIYTDGGRYYRPLFRVVNNELVLKRKHVNAIQTKGIFDYAINRQSKMTVEKTDKISTWNKFMATYPEVLEYIDVEESIYTMVAMNQTEVIKNYQKMISPLGNPSVTKINRYGDNVFVKYTHMEIHPFMWIGEVVANIPFFNHTPVPRNIFQFSQMKQAIGIPMTNYRHRLDITYIMYNPQRPLVETRTARYLNMDILPAGENLIVGIASYGGYNIEDAVIGNQASIDRGLIRVSVLKKYVAMVKKNMATSQNEMFMKPDPSKVIGMRDDKIYSKLNEKGFAPEETELLPGEAVIGKCIPIQTTEKNNKGWKDNSEIYRSSKAIGFVDRTYPDLVNADGHKMYKILVRSERVAQIGDKICSRPAQKNSLGITFAPEDMPITAKGIIPDIIINPNAFPSRMTMNHMIETLIGKAAALKGCIADGTAYQSIDLKEPGKILEEHGFQADGHEIMYNGMTGKKIEADIFVGPTYYQRLRHIVADKIHSRSNRGPTQMLTRRVFRCLSVC